MDFDIVEIDLRIAVGAFKDFDGLNHAGFSARARFLFFESCFSFFINGRQGDDRIVFPADDGKGRIAVEPAGHPAGHFA